MRLQRLPRQPRAAVGLERRIGSVDAGGIEYFATHLADLRATSPNTLIVDASSIRIGGQVVGPSTTYRVAMNNFLADGGDNFPAFTQGTNPLGGEVDLDALTAYLAASSPVAP